MACFRTQYLIILCLLIGACRSPDQAPQSHFDQEPLIANTQTGNPVKFLMWPIAGHHVSQDFRLEGRRKRSHDGIDISAKSGSHIFAPADGTVIYAGQAFHGYGRMIMIQHTPHITTLYGHCQRMYVHSGEAVKKGNLIALVGRSGRATAPHLHFEVRVNREPVDPFLYLED